MNECMSDDAKTEVKQLELFPSALKRSVVTRADKKSQVRHCFGFCTADFWSSVAYESAELDNLTNIV